VLRPSRLAWYMAVSALRKSVALSVPSCGQTQIPMLAPAG